MKNSKIEDTDATQKELKKIQTNVNKKIIIIIQKKQYCILKRKLRQWIAVIGTQKEEESQDIMLFK